MDNLTGKEKSYLEWLFDQRNRTDVVASYARAIIDDFESGNRFKLIHTACSEKVDDWEISNFSAYCKANGLPQGVVDLLLLGNAMAVMEFNVGIITGQIPYHALDDKAADLIRRHIADTCDVISAIIQDMESGFKADNPGF